MNNKHRNRLHPPQQGLPHAHHHLHHCMWRWLSPFSESLPILFLRRWNYLEMFFAASRERMLYHPNATAILKVWPLSVQCALCINNIFPTEQTIGKLDYHLWSIFSCSRTSISMQTFLSEAMQLQVEWFISIVGWNISIRCKKFHRIDLYQLRVRWNFLVEWRRANCLAVHPQQRHMDRLPCNDNDKDKYRDKDKGLPLAVHLQRLRSL